MLGLGPAAEVIAPGRAASPREVHLRCALLFLPSRYKCWLNPHCGGEPSMALTSGPQLRAARAMARVDQETLARDAGITAATVQRLEAMEGRLKSTTTTIDS